MPKNAITLDDMLSFIESLPFEDFNKVVKRYSEKTGNDYSQEMKRLINNSLQQKLEILDVNSSCPACFSHSIIKAGVRNDIQSYRCKECGHKFTRFSGTILEKTRWHWDIWVKVVQMILNDYSLIDMQNVLVSDLGCDGIDIKTIWLWRLKIMHALASIPMPKLTGVIQIDETYIRESQKGGRHLVTYLKDEDRLPRYGRRASVLGTMGPEFATVVAAVDNRGFCVCKVVALGRVTKELFYDTFDEYISFPSFICTDRNLIYRDYCKHKKYAHYERPSLYMDIIKDAGYVTPNFSLSAAAIERRQKENDIILKRLYKDGLIDKIFDYKGKISYNYEEFQKLKYANLLSLGRVNELHSEIKKFINTEKTNVSTKYLADYIGYFTYIKNWQAKNGHVPVSLVDAERILIDALTSKANYTYEDASTQKLNLPKPSGQYVSMLKKETKRIRFISANKYFKFNVEDGLKTFNRRDYLLDLPNTKLRNIGKLCHIPKYSTMNSWSLASAIMKSPKSVEIIYDLLVKDRKNPIDEEDLQMIKDGDYVMSLLGKKK